MTEYSPLDDEGETLGAVEFEPVNVGAVVEAAGSQVAAEELDGSQLAPHECIKRFVSNHKGKVALGAFALSCVLTLGTNTIDAVEHDVGNALPWLGGSVAATELAFVSGAAMMAISVGKHIGNPLTIKSRLPEIARQANGSRVYKSGFWVNIAGAVGTPVAVGVVVLAKLPPESYGVLSAPALDLGLTAARGWAMYPRVLPANSPTNSEE